MAYAFDLFGWYAGEGAGKRSTDTAPTNLSTSETEGELRSNWTGHTWVELPYIHRPIPVPKAPVPDEVTMRQGRLALLAAGLLSTVEAVIAAMPEPAKTAALIEWEYSSTLRRDHALVLALQPALGLTDEEVDDLFRNAFTF